VLIYYGVSQQRYFGAAHSHTFNSRKNIPSRQTMASFSIQEVLPPSKDWKYASHRMRDTIMHHSNGIPLSDYIIKKASFVTYILVLSFV
jgi:hypothetical protein